MNDSEATTNREEHLSTERLQLEYDGLDIMAKARLQMVAENEKTSVLSVLADTMKKSTEGMNRAALATQYSSIPKFMMVH